MSSEFGRLSAWRDTAALDAAKAKDHGARLELRGRAEDEALARREYLQLLGVAPGERVLDVGCGSGVVTRALAELVGPRGAVVGMDSSPALLDVAREYANEDGIADRIEWRVGDCRQMPFEGGSFDAVIAATVLAHVPDAERALAEMVRVTKFGGRVGVFDFDGDGFLISHPDRQVTRRIVAAQCDHGAVDGQLVRHLPGLLTRLGLDDVKAKAFMPLERDPAGFYAGFAKRAASTAAKAGAITEEELSTWLTAFDEILRTDRFIGGRLHLFVWGNKR